MISLRLAEKAPYRCFILGQKVSKASLLTFRASSSSSWGCELEEDEDED